MFNLPDYYTLFSYYEMGGFVMLPLIVVAVLLWYALTYRLMIITRSRKSPRELLRLSRKNSLEPRTVTARAVISAVEIAKNATNTQQLKSRLNEEFMEIRRNINQFRTMARSLVAVAPLLGLLGTVDGMIETFDSLGDMALFTNSGGIAGGISRALFTTQMGLAISIPGLLIGRVIEHKQIIIHRELDQIKDLVCTAQNTTK